MSGVSPPGDPGARTGDGPGEQELRDAFAGAFTEDGDDADLVALVTRPDLPASFARRRLTLAAGSVRPADATEWAGSLVLVEQGRLEVDCRGAGQHTFEAGDLLVLGWLPLQTLRNPGDVPVHLVAIRRRGHRVTARLLRVIRHIRTDHSPGGRRGPE